MKVIEKGYKKDIQSCSRVDHTMNSFKIDAKNIDSVHRSLSILCNEKIEIDKLNYDPSRSKSYKLTQEYFMDIYTAFSSTIEVYTPFTLLPGRTFKSVNSGSVSFNALMYEVKVLYDKEVEARNLIVDMYFECELMDRKGKVRLSIDEIPNVDLVEDNGERFFKTFTRSQPARIIKCVFMTLDKKVYIDPLTHEKTEVVEKDKIKSMADIINLRLGRAAEVAYRRYVSMYVQELFSQSIIYKIAIPKSNAINTIQSKVDACLQLLSRLNQKSYGNKSIHDLIVMHNELYVIKQRFQ